MLFRKETFYLRNRVFLILILLLPAFFPVLKIPVVTPPVAPAEIIASEMLSFSEASEATVVSDAGKTFEYNRLFTIIYFVVAGVLLLRVVISLGSTYRIIRKGTIRDNKFPRVVISDDQLPPFSFFPYAVIPTEEFKTGNYTDLLEHEFAHIKQGHTFDLILSEIFIAFQWFNPLIWIIKRSIVLNHEYLADHVSLSNKSIKEYQYRLLNFQPGLRHISLAHNFNSLIKNRIIMINKKPTRKHAALKSIIILPVVAFLAYSFATPEYRSVPAVSDPLTIYETPAIIQQEVKVTAGDPKTSTFLPQASDRIVVVVEQMPEYPGGDKELLNFIKNNTKYPEELRKDKIEGKVIVRFVVNTEGKVDGISVLKSLNPLMDAEARHVISMLPRFTPGMQGGKPVNVWYVAPVTFSLSTAEKLFTKTSETDILKFVGMNTGYPQEAKAAFDTGSVYVVLKLQKGGTIKNCEAFTDRKDVKAPFLPEVVIVGYKPSAAQNAPEVVNQAGKEHPLLKAESLRVVNNLSVTEIPDWADKDLEFALAIKFILK